MRYIVSIPKKKEFVHTVVQGLYVCINIIIMNQESNNSIYVVHSGTPRSINIAS